MSLSPFDLIKEARQPRGGMKRYRFCDTSVVAIHRNGKIPLQIGLGFRVGPYRNGSYLEHPSFEAVTRDISNLKPGPQLLICTMVLLHMMRFKVWGCSVGMASVRPFKFWDPESNLNSKHQPNPRTLKVVPEALNPKPQNLKQSPLPG